MLTDSCIYKYSCDSW